MLETHGLIGSENYSGKQNLVNVEAGIIIQLDGQERSFIQKFGRSLRADNPIQYIFYYQNSRDQEYLEDVISDVDPNFIKVLNL